MNKILRVKCPHCATIFSYYESEFRPFCSERCKLVDLGHWFEETYRVPDKNKIPTETDVYEDQDKDQNNSEQSYDEQDDESEYEN